MQLLYFGWVRSKIGISGETIDPPADVADVRGQGNGAAVGAVGAHDLHADREAL